MQLQEILQSLLSLYNNNSITDKIEQLSRNKGSVLFWETKELFPENIWLRKVLSSVDYPVYWQNCSIYPHFAYCSLLDHFPDFVHSFRKQQKEHAYKIVTSETNILKRIKNIFKPTINTETFLTQSFLSSWIESLEESMPCIMCYENLHSADADTLESILFLIQAFQNKPVLFLLTLNPELIDVPILPKELQGDNVPIMQKLQAMKKLQNVGSKSINNIVKSILKLGEKREWNTFAHDHFFTILQTIFDSSDTFLVKLLELSQKDAFCLGQILIYFSDLLVSNGKKWKLPYSETEIDIPTNIHTILLENIGQVSNSVLELLQYVATALRTCTKEEIADIMQISQDSLEQILQEACNQGILQVVCNKYIVFTTEDQRTIILDHLSQKELQKFHSIWAEYCEQNKLLNTICYEHYLKSETPECALNWILQAGQEMEELGGIQEAYRLYRMARENFPEILDIYQEDLKTLQQLFTSKSKEKQETIEQKFTSLLLLYRVATLESETPWNKLLQKKFSSLYSYNCTFEHFSELFLLVSYLLQINIIKKKQYVAEDIIFFTNILSKKVLPKTFISMQCLLLEQEQTGQIRNNLDLSLYRLYNYGRKYVTHFSDFFLYSLRAVYYAKANKDYDVAGSMLHKMLKQSFSIEVPDDFVWYEIEILYQLGLLYEEQAKLLEDDKQIQYMMSAVYAYIDAFQLLNNKTASFFVAEFIIQHALELCQRYSIEDNLVLSLVQEIKTKRSIFAEENPKKILVIGNNQSIGTISILENFFYDFNITIEWNDAYKGMNLQQLQEDYDITILLVSYDLEYWQAWKNAFTASSVTEEHFKMNNAGWFIMDHQHKITTVLYSNLATDLLPIAIHLYKSKKLLGYL